MAKQADVNEQLRKAVEEGDEDTVRLLLKEIGNPNCSTYKCFGYTTLLIVASGKGYKSIVQLLVKSGENVNETDDIEQTALHWAAMGGHHDIVLYLIEMEANVNAVDEFGRTPLHFAAWNEHEVTVRFLMEQKANPNIPDRDGNTPLHFAAKRNKAAVIDVLLKNKADADCRNKDGETSLHLAAKYNDVAVIDVLLRNKADVDCRNENGDTPLHLAVERDNHALIDVLLTSKANANAKNEDGETALHLAVKRNRARAIDVLLKNKAHADCRNKDGETALHLAAKYSEVAVIDVLLKNKADADCRNKNGDTPLHLAVERHNHALIDVLLTSKANANAKNEDGETPLHLAVKLNRARVIDVLLKNKAHADCRNKDGDTPLHLAALRNNGATVNVLLTNKANADAENKRGQKPYDLARDKQLKKVLQFAVLYAEGTVPPKVMKLCVIGAAGAGKTTFLNALKRGFFAWLISRENQDDDPTCEYERTVGINVRTINIPGVGTFALFDHAGQKQFHKTHGLFFKALNSFFILLLSLVKGDQRLARSLEELIAEAQYWLSFLRASLENEFIPTVMIAASRADCCPDGHRLLERVVNHMQDLFQGKVNITEESFLLDCRKSHSSEMMKFRVFLKQMREEFLKRSDIRYPRLCEPIANKLLPALRHKEKEPFMETERLVEAINKDKGKGQTQTILDKVVDFLDETGEVIKVGDVVSLNPCWLSQYALGPIIAAEDMKWHAKAPDGRMTREEAERAIKQYLRDHNIKVNVKVDTVLKLLLNLGLAFILEDGTYMIPARLPPLQHVSEVWKKEEEKKVYVGRRQLCSSPTSIFSPAAFSLFQCQACIQIDKLACLWRDVIIVERAESVESHVQCLVTTVDSLRAVDFIARGREGSESHCLSLLDDVTKVWAHTVKEHSPGTNYETGYMSRKHLCEHRENIAVYLQSEVNEVIARGPTAAVRKVIGREHLVENLQDLMVLPQSPQHLQDSTLQQKQINQQKAESSELMKQDTSSKASSESVDIEELKSLAGEVRVSEVIEAVVKHGSNQWYETGLALGLADAAIMGKTHAIPNYPGKLRAIIEMKRQDVGYEGLRHALVKVCFEIDTPIAVSVRDALWEVKTASQK